MNDARSPAGQAARLPAAILLLLLALCAWVYLLLAQAPPYLDEGDHAFIGRVLLRGGLMYVDAFNEKGPGLYWITAGLFGLFGDSFRVIRLAAGCCNLLSVLLLFALGLRLGRPWAGLAAAAIYGMGLALLQGYLWTPESLLTPLILLLMLLGLPDEQQRLGRWAPLLLGLALCEATLIKQTAWLLAVALLAAWALTRRRRRDLPQQPGLVALGLCLPWGLILLLQLRLGALREFLAGYTFPLYGYVPGYYVHLPAAWQMLILAPVCWMALVGALGPRRAGIEPRAWSTLSALIAAAALMALPAPFLLHFSPLLALGALGLCCSLRRSGTTINLAAVAVTLLLAGAILAARPYKHLLAEKNPARTAGMQQVAARISGLARPGDSLFVFPHNSLYYYLSDVGPPGRIGFLLPWTSSPAMVAEAAADIEQRTPQLVGYNFYEICTTNGILPRDYLAPLLQGLLGRYRIDRAFGNGMVLLVRADDADGQERERLRRLLFSDVQCLETGPAAHADSFKIEDVIGYAP